MDTAKDNGIIRLSMAAKFEILQNGNHYLFRYIGRKTNPNAPDLVFEVDSDEDHLEDALRQKKYEYLQELRVKDIGPAGTGINFLNFLIAQMRDYKIMRKIDEQNLEYIKKNHPEKLDDTQDINNISKETRQEKEKKELFLRRLFAK